MQPKLIKLGYIFVQPRKQQTFQGYTSETETNPSNKRGITQKLSNCDFKDYNKRKFNQLEK